MKVAGRVIGIDLGLKRVGVSISDEMNLMAHPLCVVPYEGPDRLAQTMVELARAHGVSSFVVGMPKNMDGTIGQAGKRAEKFAGKLSRLSGMPVALRDERLTTSQAEKEMIALGKSRKSRKSNIDEAAAVLILEDFLRSQLRAPEGVEGQ